MAESTAAFKTTKMLTLDFILDNMIRQQKYPTTAAAKKAAAALRAQLHQELESKKLCTYQPHECTQLTLDGYDFCLRHIMEDKNAPFRQCSYVYNNNGKRCHMPAPKGEKKEPTYCTDHAFKSHLTRVRAAARHQPINSIETLLDSLSHYVAPNNAKTPTKQETLEDTKPDENPNDVKFTKFIDPYTDISPSVINSSRSRVLDFGSESESDVEPTTYPSVWHDANADSSDDESIDSDQEDVLKHAGIYTAEEVTLVTRDKLIRLQSLYIEQFKHLQYVLKERRRKYLHSLKRERDSLSTIHDQVHDTLKEKRMYNKLKALHHYHKKHGIDAIMNKKFTDLRAKLTEGSNAKPQTFTKCTYSEDGVKCGERALPMAKHCRKHVLYDQQQVLFKRCCRVQADFDCNEPVLAMFKDPTCKYHTDLPAIRNYGETRTFDDSDMEDSSDTHDQHVLDMMASSSCDSRAATSTSAVQIMNFANQFPGAHDYHDPTLEMFDAESKDLLDIDNTSDDYIKDVTNEIDVTSVDDNLPFGGIGSGQDDTNSSQFNAEQLALEQEVEVMDIETNDDVETDLPVIDPDDDMAGIMLELQKDSQQNNATDT